MPYVAPDVIVDEGAMAALFLDELAARIPGWEEQEGSIETQLAEAKGVLSATLATLLVDTAADAYRGFAERILGMVFQQATPAYAAATFSLADDAGYTVPAGTQVTVAAPDGSPVGFTVLGDHVAAAGTTTLGGVPVASIEAGAHTNGCSGPAILETGVVGVTGATITTSSGGADPETQQEFLDRATARARRLSAIPITAGDHAAAALDHPAAARALAVSLFDPASPTDPPDSPGHVTVWVVDEAGAPLPAAQRTEVKALLEPPGRVLNVQVHVEAPTVVAVNVVASVWPTDGFSAADAIAGATMAISDYLDPARWGLETEAPGLWSTPDRAAERMVTDLGVAAAIRKASPAVAGVSSVTVNGGASVSLAGWATLPNAGTVTVTEAA